jgi:hypothetical protein
MIANPTLMIERERRRPIPSKQATLDYMMPASSYQGVLDPLLVPTVARRKPSIRYRASSGGEP